jgi:hypothetical protein
MRSLGAGRFVRYGAGRASFAPRDASRGFPPSHVAEAGADLPYRKRLHASRLVPKWDGLFVKMILCPIMGRLEEAKRDEENRHFRDFLV